MESLTKPILEDIQIALATIKKADDCFMTCCLVTDVTKNISALLVDGPEDFKDVIGYPTWNSLDWGYDLPGVVSRKK